MQHNIWGLAAWLSCSLKESESVKVNVANTFVNLKGNVLILLKYTHKLKDMELAQKQLSQSRRHYPATLIYIAPFHNNR